MKNAFEILARFMERGEPEVEGRQLEAPPEAVQLKLRQFARGLLPAAEQPELIGQLNENRHWISVLADEVKALRKTGGN